MAWKILNKLGMYRVGIGWVLCPFPCDVFAVFQSGTPPLTPSEWKLSQRLEALEAREQDRELRIALQEDRIQELQREVDELPKNFRWSGKIIFTTPSSTIF